VDDAPVRSGISSRVRVGEVVAVLGGAALLAGSWIVVAATHRVPEAEQRVFEAVNDLPDFLWPVVWVPMQSGSLVGSLVVVAGTAVVSRNRRLTLAALVASQVAFWSVKIVKSVVSRGRPSALLHSFHLREHAAGLGYASGHTAVAFALATVLAPSLPRTWRPVVFVIAGVVVGFATEPETPLAVTTETEVTEPPPASELMSSTRVLRLTRSAAGFCGPRKCAMPSVTAHHPIVFVFFNLP
jgi:hypothetical protein